MAEQTDNKVRTAVPAVDLQIENEAGQVILRNSSGYIRLGHREVEILRKIFAEDPLKMSITERKLDNAKKYPHYFKELPEGATHIDVYMVLDLFGVTSQWIGHSIKKLLCPGQRHSKSFLQDVTEARNTLNRGLEIESLKDKGGTGE